MELRELRLEQVPGLPAPLKLEGAPGLNLILGPNGSGKSTLTRSVLGLLWPDESGRGHLSAVWQHGDATWHAARAGGSTVVWQREGQPHPPPALPYPDHATSFHLGLLDLLKLEADPSDQGLARAIRNQMAGGFDLGALLTARTVTGAEGRNEARELVRAEEQVRALRIRQRTLQEDEARLARLHDQLQAAQAAAARAAALRQADLAAAAQARAQAAATELGAHFPPVMDRVQAGDLETLERLRTRERTTGEDLAATTQQIAAAEARLAGTGLAGGGPTSVQLETARNRLVEARQTAAELDRAHARAAAATAALTTTRQNLAPWGEPDDRQPLSGEQLRAEARAVHTLLTERAKHDGLDQLLRLPVLQAADAEAAPPESLATGRRTLLAWLAAGAERRTPWLPLATGILLLGLGAALQPWSGPGAGSASDWVGWSALALGAGTVLVAWWPRLRPARSRRAREAFAETGLPAPTAWTDAEVHQHLIALADQEAEVLLARLRQRLREDLTVERDRAALASAGADGEDRLDAAERLHRNALYHAALGESAAATAHCEDLDATLQRLLAEVSHSLSAWLEEPAGDVAAMTAAVEDLLHRRNTYDQYATAREADLERRSSLVQRAEETAAEIAALLGRLDLPPRPDSDALLRAYAIRLESYHVAKLEAERLAARAQVGLDALSDLPPPLQDLATEALAWPVEERSAELATAVATGDQQQDLNNEIVAIRTRLEEARRDSTLDQALLTRDRARQRLAAVRDQVRGKALGSLLLERLQQQHRRRSEPPVLQRARDLFDRFTAGRYELLIADQDSECFRARDRLTDRGLALTELSDGTRAQLLLAARLASIQEAERGAVLPLFFDEALTASDSERFTAIGQAVLELIASEKRQVFYLTCDPADVEAWQAILRGRNLPPAPVTHLTRTLEKAAAATVERLRAPLHEPVPAPAPGEDPATYADRLGTVPGLDPHAPADAAHLFHLLRDDLPLLHRLLTHQVVRAGQVEPLAGVLEAANVLTRTQREGLQARLRALAVFCEAWTVGRGRPLPPGVITAQSGLSSSKLPEIEALLAMPAVQHDARRLIDALARGEVPRLQQKVQDDLADWLSREGYLDRQPASTRHDVRTQVLQAMAADIATARLTLAGLEALVHGWWQASPVDPDGR